MGRVRKGMQGMFRKTFVSVAALTASLVVAPTAGALTTKTFSNPAPITINDATTPGVPVAASPSPLAITGVGVAAYPVITTPPVPRPTVSVTLHGVTHTSPADLDVRIVGPGSSSGVTLLDNAGGTTVPVIDADLTFSSAGTTTVPFAGPMTAGVFQPSLYTEAGAHVWRFSSPPYAPGTWSLYVADDDPEDTGVIARGFSIEISYTPDNQIDLTAGKLDRKRGIAQLLVKVLDAGVITAKSTQTVRGATFNAPAAGTYALKLRAKGKALRKLRRKGKVYVNAPVTFTPNGGTIRSETYDYFEFKLKKKKPKKK